MTARLAPETLNILLHYVVQPGKSAANASVWGMVVTSTRHHLQGIRLLSLVASGDAGTSHQDGECAAEQLIEQNRASEQCVAWFFHLPLWVNPVFGGLRAWDSWQRR